MIFRGVRGDRPPGYASHFALTDVDGGGFAYDQRVEIALSETALPSTTKVALADTDPRPPAAAIPVALFDFEVKAPSGEFDALAGDVPAAIAEAFIRGGALRPIERESIEKLLVRDGLLRE